MKLLVVTQYYYPESFSITPLCEALVRLGHDVQVLTSKPQYGFGRIPKDYRKITDEVVSGVNIHRVHTLARKKGLLSTLINYWTFYRAAAKTLQAMKNRFDLVLSVSLSPLLSIVPAIHYAQKHRLPHLLYVLDPWPEAVVAHRKNFIKGRLYRALERWSHRLYQKVDQILVGSPSYLKHFQKIVGKEVLLPEPLIQPALVEQYPSESVQYGEGYHLVYAGHIGKLNGLDQLIHRWHQLPSQVHLHIIGQGRHKLNLQTLVKRLHLDSKIHFYAHQTPDHLGKFLISADAFYVGLDADGIIGKTIPQKLVQALVFGKPILAMLQGDGKKLLQGLPFPLLLDHQARHLKVLINQLLKLTKEDLALIQSAYQNEYRQKYALARAAQTLDHHCNELIKTFKSSATLATPK